MFKNSFELFFCNILIVYWFSSPFSFPASPPLPWAWSAALAEVAAAAEALCPQVRMGMRRGWAGFLVLVWFLGSRVSKDGRSNISRILMPSPSHCRVMSQDPSSRSRYSPEGDLIQVLPAVSFWKREHYRLSYRGRATQRDMLMTFFCKKNQLALHNVVINPISNFGSCWSKCKDPICQLVCFNVQICLQKSSFYSFLNISRFFVWFLQAHCQGGQGIKIVVLEVNHSICNTSNSFEGGAKK